MVMLRRFKIPMKSMRGWINRSIRFASLSGLLLVGIGSRGFAADASAVIAAMNSITAEEAQSFINVLADDSLEGREAGSRGGRAAGNYLAQQFQKLGLKGAAAGGGYFQPFNNSLRNILASIEGSDPELKKQYVLVTAHYDHIGYGNRSNALGGIGQIHNGADDNASGDAGILETAEAFSHLPQAPKRTVIFALWDGEEEGLYGSKYWIEHPTVPLASVAAVINVDMIGRLRSNRVIVYGARTSFGWRQLLSRDNESTGLMLDFDWTMKADSDHHPFFAAGVPVVMLHTGLHDDYHRPSDKAEKINSNGLRLVSQLMFRTALDLADEDVRPKFRTAARSESPSEQSNAERLEPPAPGRLGLSWDEAKAKDGVIQLISVTSESTAAKAGLKVGDRIVSYAGRKLDDVEQFRRLVMGTRGTVSVEVERKGSEEPLELTVKPTGEPAKLGIAWRVDDAEPDAVLLVRVAPGSPADRAGLRIYDRIYEVGGRRFATSDEFRQLANSLPAPLEFLVETQGKTRHVTIEPLETVTDAPAKTPPIPATAQR